MTIRERLEADMKDALRARESSRLTCIRMLKSKIQEREVALRGERGRVSGLTEEETQAVLATYAKQRREAIDGYRAGGREELAAAEEMELEWVLAYLPRQLSEAELRAIVVEARAEVGQSDLGSVMRLVMPKVRGLANGKLVNRIVREILDAG